MRLLVVSDLHYRLPQFDWLRAAATDPERAVDVVVIAGDMLDIRSAVPLEAQSVALSATLTALGATVPLLAASGNHDLDSRDAHGEKAAGWLRALRTDRLWVDDDSVMIEDTLFTVCPWWEGPVGQARLVERFVADAERPKARWVWVYHAPPTGSPLAWDGRREFGDREVREWIDTFAPDIVLAGHIHQAPFVPDGDWMGRQGTTWLFNPGHQPGPVPTYVVLDLTEMTATWRAATAEDIRSLVEPSPRKL